MQNVGFSQIPYRNVVLIGIGTVFGTMGFILVALLLSPVLWSPAPRLDAVELLKFVPIYVFVGVILATAICLVLAAPMLLLWRPIFILFRKRGLSLPAAAMASAGGMAFLGTIGVCSFAQWNGAAKFPAYVWPIVIVPVGISVFLANRLSYDRSGAVWE